MECLDIRTGIDGFNPFKGTVDDSKDDNSYKSKNIYIEDLYPISNEDITSPLAKVLTSFSKIQFIHVYC